MLVDEDLLRAIDEAMVRVFMPKIRYKRYGYTLTDDDVKA